MNPENTLQSAFISAFKALYDHEPEADQVQVQKTRKDFDGDFTINVFPFLRTSRQSPEETASAAGKYLVENERSVADFNVIKGFLNLRLSDTYWVNALTGISADESFGRSEPEGGTVLVEFSSPNTNKPLHLGHLRNIFLGDSVARILENCGRKVVRTQIINDRGIHICKSMVAYKRFGSDQTPESTGKKGDHFVGDFYVLFDKEYKKQVAKLMDAGKTEEEAKEEAPLMREAREMLMKWENNDPETVALWKKMNDLVYAGFDVTYDSIGVKFDKLYYESQTYLKGREAVKNGLDKNIFFKKENGSVWVDLSEDGLDEKLLLRADGTAVYITQDIGTAIQRYEDYPDTEQVIYTVGNEQDYHFQVLFKILEKLGFDRASNCYHLSYGMVELPEGRMKSREGNVVDADDIVSEMIAGALEQGKDKGSYEELSDDEREDLAQKVGLAALKYFILKVDPQKNMTFNPKESIDLNGDTGPFIQYTYARTASILRRAKNIPQTVSTGHLPDEDREVIKVITRYPEAVKEAGEKYSPSVISRYCFDLAKTYNTFYQNTPIFHAEDENLINRRILLTQQVGKTLKSGMELLGIEMPERF